MKLTKLNISLILLFALSFNTCKKYDEGGLVKQTCKHLFGGHKAGNSKTWKLKLYEVNGIDSTNLIQGSNFDNFITFKYVQSEPSIEYRATTSFQNYSGTVSEKKILIAYDWDTHNDSIQCNNNYCQRNILFPEFLNLNPRWEIKKLTSKEFIISIDLKNSYKIILTQ
ncbi:MAG: hypothetical protein Q8L81_13915 [Bacteroidota bacterium]|nr:hypothetical protein [Bacteroidota bacterium]